MTGRSSDKRGLLGKLVGKGRTLARGLLGRATDYTTAEHFSTSEPDWEREVPMGLWDPPRRLMQTVRQYQHWKQRGGPAGWVVSRAWVVPYRFWSAVLSSDIPLNAEYGGGFQLLHGQGIVVHDRSKIGPNCLLAQGVTLGGDPAGGAPTLKGRVEVGPGAKIFGAVTIGNNARIGANSVVLIDVPDGALAVGSPARVIEGRGYSAPDEAEPSDQGEPSKSD